MSNKAKNLTYEAAEPAFLQRMRGAVTSGDSARHERPIPRNKRLQKDGEDDDEPTYVLEDSNQSLSKAEYDAMVAGKELPDTDATEDAKVDSEGKNALEQQPKDNIAEVGKATKKRKAVKVIGADSEEQDSITSGKTAVKAVKKPKKKAKVVKLSFGDQEEG